MRKAFSRLAVHRRVVVNLKTGPAIEGVLWAEEGPLLVLRDAYIHEGTGPVPMDGEVIVDRANVAFVQAPAT